MKYLIFDRGRGSKAAFVARMKRAAKRVKPAKMQPAKSIPKSAGAVDK